MDTYNNYYTGHPPPTRLNAHHHSQSHLQPSPSGHMMHVTTIPPHQSHNNRHQAMPPGPSIHQQAPQPTHQQLLTQHHSPHSITPQQQHQHQHPHYHQLHSPHTHSSLSNSGSPHPQQSNHQQHLSHHQNSVTSHQTGPSSHHVHPQSPHSHSGSPMHMQQQQQQQPHINHQLVRPPLGPSPVMNHQSHTVVHQQTRHHQQTYYNNNSMSHTPSPQHYVQSHHNQQPQQSAHHHHQQQQPNHHHRQTPSVHHGSAMSSHQQSPIQQNIGRNSPCPSVHQTEFRIIELNRWLQSRPSSKQPFSPQQNQHVYDDGRFWENFAIEFFEDDATLTLRIQDDKPMEYTLGRTLIPRFFRSYFDGGVTDLSFNLRNPKELHPHPHLTTLNCDQAFVVSIFRHPSVTASPGLVVHTEGQLIIDFVNNSSDNLSIKSWKFYTRNCREYIDRSMTAIGNSHRHLAEPITFQGLPSSTMLYLKMCSVVESMQELMSQQKMTNLEPKVCLKQVLYDRFRFKCDDDPKANSGPVTKRRKRKAPNSPSTTRKMKSPSISTNSNPIGVASPPIPNCLPPLNVMIVGDPLSMGLEYRDNNERSISKIENSNYVPVESPPEPPSRIEVNHDAINNYSTSNENYTQDEHNEEITETKQEQHQHQQTGDLDESAIIVSELKLDRVKSLENKCEDSSSTSIEDKSHTSNEEFSKQSSTNETVEKENNIHAINDESHINSDTPQNDSHFNIMTSIPEDREDASGHISNDSALSKLPPSSNNKNALTSNGSNNKQNRRRSSERKETLREGLMRTSDFVVAMKDLKSEHPALWRITTGNNLLQQFEPKVQSGVVLYENTNQYAGWYPDIKKDYVGVDVKLTQHTRNQITVERLFLNFQKIEDAEAFHDKHFVIYLQILISTALDPKFWESIESEPKHHDYFITSRRIIEDIIKRYKVKLSNKLKLSETALKNIEKYPNLVINTHTKDESKEHLCRACNTNPSTQNLTFAYKSYDLHSYKLDKVASELIKADEKLTDYNLCEACLDMVKLYSQVHHMGWNFFNLARDKVEQHRTKGKPVNAILDECLKDEDWLSIIYAERDALWSKIELIQ